MFNGGGASSDGVPISSSVALIFRLVGFQRSSHVVLECNGGGDFQRATSKASYLDRIWKVGVPGAYGALSSDSPSSVRGFSRELATVSPCQ